MSFIKRYLIIKGSKKPAIIDEEDYEKIKKYTWSYHNNMIQAYDYDNKKQFVFTWAILGKPDYGFMWDHINRDPLDNRKSNLRLVTSAQNNQNRSKSKNKGSVYKGVSWRIRYKKWKSAIRVNYKLIHLGMYINEWDAALAYNNAAKKYFGEFAVLNVRELKCPS